jgi:hypothetical protein
LTHSLGGRREPINKQKIQEVLDKIDPDYRKHANAVISKAGEELRNVFGYQLVTSHSIVGWKDVKKDEYFLLSTSTSKKLRFLLSKADHSGAYFGFMMVVLFAIMLAPGEKLACIDLLNAVRFIEPRFPVVLTKSALGAALAVPELGDDFLGLLGRMKKVSGCSV